MPECLSLLASLEELHCGGWDNEGEVLITAALDAAMGALTRLTSL